MTTRNTKPRAWVKGSGTMRYDVIGLQWNYKVAQMEGRGRIGVLFPVKDEPKTIHIAWLGIDVDIMYPTGIKDKNGKEIYEDDIVTWGFGNVIVRMGTIPVNDSIPSGVGTGWVTNDSFVDSHCEIIGNIHENPELLEDFYEFS